MCIGSKPKTVVVEKPVPAPVEEKVEKIPDPTPTPITPTDTGNAADRMQAENERNRKKRGFAATRVAQDRNVLTDAAQGNTGRQTLG